MKELSGLQEIKDFLASIEHPLMLVLFGAILTAIVQSSSVVTSIALTMAVTGLISLNQGIYLTLGSNIGSCVVAIIAGMTSGTNAKRTALMHLLFNCFGVVVFMIAAWVVNLSTGGSIDFGYMFESMFPSAPQLQMAMFHTIFNVITVFLIIGLTNQLVNLVCRIIPDSAKDKEELEEEPHYFYVDEKMLRTPIIAVPQVKLEIEHMASIAMRNFDIAIQTAINMDFSDKKEFQKNELQLNYLNRALVTYIVQLNNSTISEVDRRYLTSAIRSISDIERVGDYAENIVEYAAVLSAANEKFPESTCLEFEQMKETITTLYNHVMKAYNEQDMESLRLAKEVEEQVDDLTEYMEQKHIDRLTSGEYSATVGAQYLEFASDSERIADHLLNVARTIKDLQIEQ
jgi:phosphate:Na+ symporter